MNIIAYKGKAPATYPQILPDTAFVNRLTNQRNLKQQNNERNNDL